MSLSSEERLQNTFPDWYPSVSTCTLKQVERRTALSFLHFLPQHVIFVEDYDAVKWKAVCCWQWADYR